MEYALGCFYDQDYPTAALLSGCAEEHYSKQLPPGTAALSELQDRFYRSVLANRAEVTEIANVYKRWVKHGSAEAKEFKDLELLAAQLIMRALANRLQIRDRIESWEVVTREFDEKFRARRPDIYLDSGETA